MAEHQEIIIGIDPGTQVTGFGLVERKGSSFKALDYGCIRPPASLKLSERYLIIFNGIETLLEKYAPKVLAVETQYVNKNVQSAIKLGMARGMAILAAKRRGLSIFEYTPSEAKLAVSGKGNSSKFQVQEMLKVLLNLVDIPEPEDASDALSIAICHAHASTHQAFCSKEI